MQPPSKPTGNDYRLTQESNTSTSENWRRKRPAGRYKSSQERLSAPGHLRLSLLQSIVIDIVSDLISIPLAYLHGLAKVIADIDP